MIQPSRGQRKALGNAAIKRPAFAFGSAVTSKSAFTATSIKLEDTGVQAYQGQTPFIKSNDVLKAAISIHPVEARHAAWIRNLAHQNPAPGGVQPRVDEVRRSRRGRRDRLHQVEKEARLPNIGPMELIIVLVIALVVLGPKRLPDAGKSLGRGIREFKGSLSVTFWLPLRHVRRHPRQSLAAQDPARDV